MHGCSDLPFAKLPTALARHLRSLESRFMLILLFIVAVWAGAQNALAGGGSFVTLPALILSGLDARSANIASTLALFPAR